MQGAWPSPVRFLKAFGVRKEDTDAGAEDAPSEQERDAAAAALGGYAAPAGLGLSFAFLGRRARDGVKEEGKATPANLAAAAALPSLPAVSRRRKARPGQEFPDHVRPPAGARRRGAAPQHDDDHDMGGGGGGDDAAPAAAPPLTKREVRNGKRSAADGAARAQNTHDYVLYQPDHARLREERRIALQNVMQRQVGEQVKRHPCAARLAAEPPAVLASHNVDVITLDGMVELVWPRHLKCSHAGCALQRAPLSPLALGLVAANPSGKNVLFDIRVIELVKELTQGVSTLSFEGALGARARAFGAGADAHKNARSVYGRARQGHGSQVQRRAAAQRVLLLHQARCIARRDARVHV
jgi:hypothetical protein